MHEPRLMTAMFPMICAAFSSDEPCGTHPFSGTAITSLASGMRSDARGPYCAAMNSNVCKQHTMSSHWQPHVRRVVAEERAAGTHLKGRTSVSLVDEHDTHRLGIVLGIASPARNSTA